MSLANEASEGYDHKKIPDHILSRIRQSEKDWEVRKDVVIYEIAQIILDAARRN